MAKTEKIEKAESTQAAAAAPTPNTASKAPSYRLLMNPSGRTVSFRLDDPAYEYHLYSQRPPGVKPDQWFREPTEAELAAYVAANPYA